MVKKFYKLFYLLPILCCQLSFAQQRTITGVVYDPENRPLPGTSVTVKGTYTSTLTNEDGRYAIDAASGQVLVFSFLGMETQ